MPKAEVVEWTEARAALVRRTFEAMVTRMAPQLVGRDPGEIEQIAENVVRETLTELANCRG